MANGYVEIHDPIANRRCLASSTSCDPTSTSDTDSMGDTAEFRLLMAYAKRRRSKKDTESPAGDSPTAPNGDAHAKGPSSPQAPANTEKTVIEETKRKRKRKALKRLSNILRCIKPQIEDKEPAAAAPNKHDVDDRCADFRADISDKGKKADEFDDVAVQLTQIADEIPFAPPPPPEIEADSPPEDDVEKVIALILREAGDRLNEAELKKASVAKELFWNYSFFKKLITALLIRMGLVTSEPDALGPQASPKTQIAVTCEVTSRLSAVDTLPMSRMLDHGARYLQEHYSSWVQQQGGYDKVFDSEDEDEVQ